MIPSRTLLASFGYFAISEAHMKMAQPKPFAASINSPLAPDGSNFPCQSNGGAFSGTPPRWPWARPSRFRSSGRLSMAAVLARFPSPTMPIPPKAVCGRLFTQSRAAARPSCKPGTWERTLKLPTLSRTPSRFRRTFPLAPQLSRGHGSTALENREYYMNCAPISLTGSSGSKANYDALPDMLIANINVAGGASCATQEESTTCTPTPVLLLTDST